MQREIDWIIEALARDRTKTKSGLAEALNIDKSGVSRMLRGERRLKFEEAQRAADYLGVSPGGGFAESEAAAFESEPPARRDDGTAPLYKAAAGENGLWIIDRTAIIERRPRAPEFAGAELVFGFYAPDDAMAPRFYTGEVVWMNPARPAAAGEDAVLMEDADDPTALKLYLCFLKEKTATRFAGVQHGRGETLSVPARGWQAAHVYARN
jgi:transcriptional regulator with XRE-family HTH domain